MKKVLWVLFCSILTALGYGMYHKTHIDFPAGERIIGFSVLAGTFLYLPLFLHHRWKGKRLQDYTLTEENLKKMRGKK